MIANIIPSFFKEGWPDQSGRGGKLSQPLSPDIRRDSSPKTGEHLNKKPRRKAGVSFAQKGKNYLASFL